MNFCACMGPKPGHRYCPCREKNEGTEPIHALFPKPVDYSKVQWTDGLGNTGIIEQSKYKFWPTHGQ